jgi:hypothetical protein
VFNKNIIISIVFGKGWDSIRFRKNMCGETAVLWQNLNDLCANLVLKDEDDSFR